MYTISKENAAWVDEIWGKLDKKLQVVAKKSRNKIPYTAVNGVHDDYMQTNPCWWTNGFWPGLMWLMYVGTKNDVYKDTAEHAENLLDAAFEDYDGLHHDVGFMWHISSGVNYRLFGGHKSKVRNLTAANILSARFNLKGNYIRAWNLDKIGWTIIDSMMNIPLLYWASKEVNDDRYRYIAQAHADKTMQDHVRPDGSINHIVSHDPLTGDVIETFAGQGFEVGSSWSRGQAWGLYGFALSYIHTQKQEYLDTAKRIAHYFISCVCDDYLPKCDFRSPDEPVIYDSTAGACAACGLIELANVVEEHEKKIYLNAAINILKAMEEKFCDWSDGNDSILQYGTGAYMDEPSRHIPIIYGDYYFAEAIYKLKGNDMLFW